MTDDFVALLNRRMEETRRSWIDNAPLLFLRNPTDTRKRLARAKVLLPRIVRYCKKVSRDLPNKSLQNGFCYRAGRSNWRAVGSYRTGA
jgi:hypothetical protein